MKKVEVNNVVCAGQFLGGEIEPGTFHGGEIEPGTFHGGEIEPGTFHGGEIEPGTFHHFCNLESSARKKDPEDRKEEVKKDNSDAESNIETQTPSDNVNDEQ